MLLMGRKMWRDDRNLSAPLMLPRAACCAEKNFEFAVLGTLQNVFGGQRISTRMRWNVRNWDQKMFIRPTELNRHLSCHKKLWHSPTAGWFTEKRFPGSLHMHRCVLYHDGINLCSHHRLIRLTSDVEACKYDEWFTQIPFRFFIASRGPNGVAPKGKQARSWM